MPVTNLTTRIETVDRFVGNTKAIIQHKVCGACYSVAELCGAFLCTEFDLSIVKKSNTAEFIKHWLSVLKENSKCILLPPPLHPLPWIIRKVCNLLFNSTSTNVRTQHETIDLAREISISQKRITL